MKTQVEPRRKQPGYKNGEERGQARFTPWFWSGRAPAKIEAAIVVCVFAAVIAILALLIQMPGPLVVRVEDDTRTPVRDARVRCTAPDGQTSHAGLTDVFGEAKWPGLAKGAWKCDVAPPDRFHGETQTGFVTVVPRSPVVWTARVERPARLVVEVVRPQGAPRAAMAVRAVCQGSLAATWEARAGILSGRATLFLPAGRACRAGIVRPELSGEGPATQATLECGTQPCTREIAGGVGEELSATLRPTMEQWTAARPPIEPDPQAAK